MALVLLVGTSAVVVAGSTGGAAADLTVASISAGGDYSCAVTTAGAAKCWGGNDDGELGDGTKTTALSPVDVSGLSAGVASVSTGGGGACALMSSGGVKCWGSDDLGDGTVNQSSVPVDVTGLASGVVGVTGGGNDACALTGGGAVKCWGDNSLGSVGDGTTTDRLTPVNVAGLGAGVTSISGRADSTCAVTAVGALECWGLNQDGVIGDGTTTNRTAPVTILGSGVAWVDVAFSHACALMIDGSLKCWGKNDHGELGDGTTTDRRSPVDVVGLSPDVVSVSAGGEHTCVVTAGGGAECWGHNDWGQLGDGPSGNSSAPVPVVGLGSNVVEISAGFLHTCALTDDGAMLCWGINFEGELGNGNASQMPTPTGVVGLGSGVVSVSAGYHYSCAILTGGELACWGENDRGQLGDGTTLERDSPVAVEGMSSGVSAVAAGDDHTCALTVDGAVSCWGNNSGGQLGDGTTSARDTPRVVDGLDSGAIAVTVGLNHSCALTEAGVVKCWGSNEWGQLGDGTFTQRPTPVAVAGLGDGVLAIDAGGTVTCAVTASHSVKCWGGENNLLGDGTANFSADPVQVSGLTSGVASISVGGLEGCAVTTGHALKCWGDGPLGNGGTNSALAPVAIPSLGSTVAAVHAGADGTCVLTVAGGVKCWGDNSYGDVGDGTTTLRDTPVPVGGLAAGVSALTVEGDHVCVAKAGAAQCWGNNTSGQLGTGSSGYSAVPIGVVGLGLDGARVPTAPASVSVAPAENAASASWVPPSDDGGASVSDYLVTITSASGGVPAGLVGPRVRVVTPGLTLSTATSTRIAGLSNGTGYRLDVAPVNRAGIGHSKLSSVVEPGAHPSTAGGYWMVGATGDVYAFGHVSYLGNALAFPVTHIEPTPTKHGYWIVDAAGEVFAFGDARYFLGAGALLPGERVTGLSSTPSGRGYWLFTDHGRVVNRGDARFLGDLHASVLNGSIVGSVATPTGQGYYMVGSDGGVFAFGDAKFRGSMGATHLNTPVNALVPTADNRGYWLVASDGGIFAFNAQFRGSMGGSALNRPVIGMVRYGNGYLMVGSDGGVFDFSNLAFHGSLGAEPPQAPIVAVASGN